jgi:hypothetical protein
LGGLAVAVYLAAGGMAVAVSYAIGGMAVAQHTISPAGVDPEAVRLLETFWPGIRDALPDAGP